MAAFDENARALALACKSLAAEAASPARPAAAMADSKKREWMWEFLLRRCSDPRLLEQLADAVPIPNDSVPLKRLFLLRSLSSDVASGSLSERTLDAVRAIMELSGDGGCDSLRVLSVSVMLECTIQYLREEFNDWQRFCDALEKFWGPCVQDTEEREEEEEEKGHEKVSMLTEELWEIRQQPNLRHHLLQKYKRSSLTDELQSFIDDAWKESGPTCLELFAVSLVDEKNSDKQAKAFNEGNISSCTEKESMKTVIDLQEKIHKQIEHSPENEWLGSHREQDDGEQLILLDEPSTGTPKAAKNVGIREVLVASNDILEGMEENEGRDERVIGSEDCSNAKIKEGTAELLKEKDAMVETKRRVVKRRLPNFKRDYSGMHLGNESGPSDKRHLRNASDGDNIVGGACAVLEYVTKETEVRSTEVSAIGDPGDLKNIEGEKKEAGQPKEDHRSSTSNVSALQLEAGDFSMEAEHHRRTGDAAIDSVSRLLPAGDLTISHQQLPGEEGGTGVEDVDAVEYEVNGEATGHTDYVEAGPDLEESSFRSSEKKRKHSRLSDAERNPLDAKRKAEASLATEIVKARSELQESMTELHKAVTDPLPEALEIANMLTSLREDIAVDGAARGHDSLHQRRLATFSKLSASLSKAITGRESVGAGEKRKRKRRNFMDRDPRAQTYEWEDTGNAMETACNTAPSSSKRARLPVTSTIQMPRIRSKKVSMYDQPYRRMHTRWSQLEEDTLKKEVARYGKGRWKFILEKNTDIFENRTEVDLKDKWRNIEKREGSCC